MKLKVLTVATHPDKGLEQLERSLKAYKYDYEVLGIGKEWKGFGTKLKEVHEWCKKTDYTHILFLDAYDTFAVGQLEIGDFDGVYFNAEKGCWPDADKKDLYPCPDMPYPYLNSGMYLANVKTLLQIFEENPYEYKTDDQRYFTDIFLSERYKVSLDYDTEYLMTIAFSEQGKDYEITDKVTNLHSGNTPCFIHGNGKTPMDKIYDIELLK